MGGSLGYNRHTTCVLCVVGVRAAARAASRWQCAVRVAVRAPKRPSAAFLLRAGAKLAENDGKTFSNFSRCAKIEAPTRGLPFRAPSSRFRAPRRVKKINLKKVLYRGDGVHMALTQPLSVVAPRGSLSYPTDRRPSLVPAKTAGK